jgi:hypothetical protein
MKENYASNSNPGSKREGDPISFFDELDTGNKNYAHNLCFIF